MELKETPVYYLENEDGLDAISFVDNPATKIEWFRFSAEFEEGVPHYTADGKLYVGPTHKDAEGRLMTGEVHTADSEYLYHEEELKLKFEINQMERIVTGPIMLADTKIWRAELKGYVKFSQEQIKDMAKKTFKKNSFTFNENHDPKKPIKGVYLVESYFIGDKVQSKLYADLPVGTWMGSFFVEDEEYWNNVIMSGNFKGFSLEGNFKTKLDGRIVEARFSDIETILNSNLNNDVKYDSIKSLLK